MAARFRQPRRPPPHRSDARILAANLRLFGLLLLAALLVRSLLAAPYSIPSESMLPTLAPGDFILAAKWPYGWSRHSFPFSLGPIVGRLGGAPPARGDVVVFKTPADDRTDYVKRLIGLPGDHIRVAGGRLILNGAAVPTLRVADVMLPASPGVPCPTASGERQAVPESGRALCRYRRYRETLPGGRSYDVLDQGRTSADDTPGFIVPAGHYFLLGDNRDRSADSRFPVAARGIGFVPAINLTARASTILFSVDGSAEWLRPSTWLPAIRWPRIGADLQPRVPRRPQ